jgi:hypothetical protein
MLKKAHEILAYQALSRHVGGHLNGSSRDYHLPTKIKLVSTTITLIGTETRLKIYILSNSKGYPFNQPPMPMLHLPLHR